MLVFYYIFHFNDLISVKSIWNSIAFVKGYFYFFIHRFQLETSKIRLQIVMMIRWLCSIFSRLQNAERKITKIIQTKKRQHRLFLSSHTPYIMKIIEINKLYYPWVGGVETHVKNIAEGLNKWAKVNVICCNTESKTTTETIHGIQVTKYKSIGKLLSLPLSWAFISNFKTHSADILHFHLSILLI